METDDAGLQLVDYIRTELKNETVRIILRTGQPGQAPERRVIVDYDINDYKAKTELTADKLFTALTAALRGYQQLQRMVETRRGLEMIIEGASTLFDFKSMQRLAEGVLTQLATLINAECGGILVLRDSATEQEKYSILAGSGCYRHFAGTSSAAALDPAAARRGQRRVPAPRTRIPSQALGAVRQDRQRPRGRGAAGNAAPADADRPLAGRGVLQPALDRVRQRHPLRAAERRHRAVGGARARPHPRAHRRQPPADLAVDQAAPRQRVQERGARHHRA